MPKKIPTRPLKELLQKTEHQAILSQKPPLEETLGWIEPKFAFILEVEGARRIDINNTQGYIAYGRAFDENTVLAFPLGVAPIHIKTMRITLLKEMPNYNPHVEKSFFKNGLPELRVA